MGPQLLILTALKRLKKKQDLFNQSLNQLIINTPIHSVCQKVALRRHCKILGSYLQQHHQHLVLEHFFGQSHTARDWQIKKK